MNNISFPIGIYTFHENPNFNYQLNRAYVMSGLPKEKIQNLANQITDIPSFVQVMLEASENATGESQLAEKLAFLRLAEFFMDEANPKKEPSYKDYIKLFYEINNNWIEEENVQRAEIPYENGFLPVLYVKPNEAEKIKGCVIIHGGFDSYKEEFLLPMIYLRQAGYAAYLFEGPGQGECIHNQKMPFTAEWHKPVSAVFDYFSIEKATLVGISLGSLLALRAAAYEKRIDNVVAWSILPSFFDVMMNMTGSKQIIIKKMIKQNMKTTFNKAAEKMKQKDALISWGLSHGQYVFGKKTPFDYLSGLQAYDLSNVAEKIDQNILLLGATHDHFIQFNMYKEEIDLLKHARSLTFRVFNENEQADNHCNFGNLNLVLSEILNWVSFHNHL